MDKKKKRDPLIIPEGFPDNEKYLTQEIAERYVLDGAIEPFIDELRAKIHQGLRRQRVKNGTDDPSIYSNRDFGLKTSTREIYQQRDNGIGVHEIQKAIDKQDTSIKFHATEKEHRVLDLLGRFAGFGYYGYSRLRKLIHMPLETPVIRWWNWRYYNPLLHLINPSGLVHIKNGYYVMENAVNLKSEIGVTGEGWGTQLRMKNAFPDDGMFENSTKPLRRMEVDLLRLDGNNDNNPSGKNLFYLQESKQNRFLRLYPESPNSWFHFTNSVSTYGYRNLIWGCFSVFDTDYFGIRIHRHDENFILCNRIAQCGMANAADSYGVWEESNTGLNIITNNNFVQNRRVSVHLTGWSTVLAHNVFDAGNTGSHPTTRQDVTTHSGGSPVNGGVTINHNTFIRPSLDSNTYNCVELDNVEFGNFKGNTITAGPGTYNYAPPYCLKLTNCEDTVIAGNGFELYGTAGIQDGGGNTRIYLGHNPGFANYNRGTDSISTTSRVVAHGLDITPTAKELKIIFTNNPTTDPGHSWITNVGATNFTLNLRNNPISALNFGWEAWVKRLA